MEQIGRGGFATVSTSSPRRAPLQAVLTDFGFSGATIARMHNTRAPDGTPTAEGDNVNVTWTYHPDSGLQVVFELD